MGFPSPVVVCCSLLALLLFEFSECATFVVDGVWKWKNPGVHIGDTVVFQDKPPYSLYIFRNKRAFTICNFSQATSLTKPGSPSSYTWHVSRPGFFYFSLDDGSKNACLHRHKLALQVRLSPSTHRDLPPPPIETVASGPAVQRPFQPKEGNSPAVSPRAADREGVPFITSNPAVPLPTGEVDSTTFRALPTSGFQHPPQLVMMGFSDVQGAFVSAVLLTLMISL